MSKFDFMNFTGGSDGEEFVVHATKYTKQQAIDLFRQEWGLEATEDMIREDIVKWYVSAPYWCGYDADGGCYTYCADGDAKGAFSVWVIPVKGGDNDAG